MSRELIFLPEVSRDFLEASEYYENLSPGRGSARFEAAFRQALDQIQAGVITHSRSFDHYHRVILARFPYNLYYRLVDSQAVITAVLYARFEPKRIEDTLNRRHGMD